MGPPRATGESGYFHALAIDYDGTLAEGDRPDPAALAALDAARTAGRAVVLVTGRILAELRAVFPDVDDHMDLIVAENGAVISVQGVERAIAPPVPDVLDAALVARGVAFRRGQVLLACDADDEGAVLAEIRRLGLEVQLVRNRGALMVMPASTSKGTGLFEGLGDLGISHHNTIAIGDAENDHSLLEVAELGVAVANAVDALKSRADVVLDLPNGAGVAAFVSGPVVLGVERVHPRRWQIDLGVLDDGSRARVPASQVNVLVTGATRQGKSYMAGVIAERLIDLGYSVLVFDPEGDHSALGRLRGVIVVGGRGSLPTPEQLIDLVRHRFGSIVVDLSTASEADRAAYLRTAPRLIDQQRARTGLPHWVIVDEAHELLGRSCELSGFPDSSVSGYCLVTHLPQELCLEALLGIDVVIAMPGGSTVDATTDLVAAAGWISHRRAAELVASASAGQAILVRRSEPGSGTTFTIGERRTAHLRHWHKYSGGGLAENRRFYFRRSDAEVTGATAGSVAELEHELHRCDSSVIRHHTAGGDLSRWIVEVLGDPPLGEAVATIEADMRAGASAHQARDRLLAAIHARHPA